MSGRSRRSFLFGRGAAGAAEPPRDADDAPGDDRAPEMPRPSPEGLAWQAQQGDVAGGRHGLPGAVAWLADYLDSDREEAAPALPSRAPHAPVLRPPGAVAEPDFLDRCTRCGDCARACPHDAIGEAPAVFRVAAGTPRIDPSVAPCRLCEDLPCIAACETGALVPDAGAMGVARVREVDCLNALGSTCSVCVEQCPVPDAISWSPRGPQVYDALCTGCGVCQYACPAPRNAIAILPNAQRGRSGAEEPSS